jgi:hypothetical protein
VFRGIKSIAITLKVLGFRRPWVKGARAWRSTTAVEPPLWICLTNPRASDCPRAEWHALCFVRISAVAQGPRLWATTSRTKQKQPG